MHSCLLSQFAMQKTLHQFSAGSRMRRAASLGPVMLLAALMLLFSFNTLAADAGIPVINATPAAGGGQNYTLSLQTLLLLTSLTFLPALLLMMTGFTRIIIVLSLLRQALGTQSTPPGQVLIGLALFLTFLSWARSSTKYTPKLTSHLPRTGSACRRPWKTVLSHSRPLC